MSEYDPIARFYDADHASFNDDVAFYRELARRTGDPVLELMCGSGRLLLPLAQSGRRVLGIDNSQAMLELARERARQAGLEQRISLRYADAREPIAGGPFALAIVGLNSFMHLATPDEQLATLRHIHGALRPGGLLAIDLFNPNPRLIAEYDNELVFDKQFTLPDGTRVQKFVAQQVDAAEQINYVTFLYDEQARDGSIRRHSIQMDMRWVYRFELEHLLARAGFELEHVYGSYELDPFRSDSEVMLAVARAVEHAL